MTYEDQEFRVWPTRYYDDVLPTMDLRLAQDVWDHVRGREEVARRLAQALGVQRVEWDQEVWLRRIRNGSCVTACCAAGAAAVLAGWAPSGGGYTIANRTDYGNVEYGGTVREVDDVAREALGLTDEEAQALFAGANEAAHMADLLEDYARHRGVELVLDRG